MRYKTVTANRLHTHTEGNSKVRSRTVQIIWSVQLVGLSLFLKGLMVELGLKIKNAEGQREAYQR